MGFFTALRADVYPGSAPALGDPGGFALGTAAAMGWAAQLAYEIDAAKKADAIIARWGWKPAVRFASQIVPGWPITVGKGFATAIGTTTILAFAGTEPEKPQDWITDFSALASEGLHDGFRTVVDRIWPQIEDAAGSAQHLLLTGHSLGGALALIAALRLAAEPASAGKLAGVYTFGQPRALTAQYLLDASGLPAALPASRIYRLVHGSDIVPRVPPALSPFHYRHVGLLLDCERQGRFAATPAAPLDENDFSDASLLAALGSVVTGPFTGNNEPTYPAEHESAGSLVGSLNVVLRDHLMDNYLRALAAL